MPESNDDLEKGDSDLNILRDDLMEDDSAPITEIFELSKQTWFIDGDKNCNDRDNCEEWEKHSF